MLIEGTGKEFADELVDLLTTKLEQETADLKQRLAAAEKQLEELQAVHANAMKFTGTFNRVTNYSRGHVAVHGGNLWYCLRDCAGTLSW
jgi:hypothetical protein